MDFDWLKRTEDEVKTEIDSWCKGKQAIAYKYLHNLDVSLANVDYLIDKEVKEQKDTQLTGRRFLPVP